MTVTSDTATEALGTAGQEPTTIPAVSLRGVRQSFGAWTPSGGSTCRRPRRGRGVPRAQRGGQDLHHRHLLGLARPDRGEVEVYGLAAGAAVARGLVSAVMQSGGLLKDLTVAETVG